MAQVGYSDEVRAKAAAIYAVTGNQTEAYRQVGVSQPTMSLWLKDPSFQTLVNDCKLQQGARIRAGLASVVDKAIGLMHDRLANGDTVYVAGPDKSGAVPVLRPMSGKDLGIVAAIAIDKAVILDKHASGTDDAGRIESLLQRLERVANATSPAPQTVDAEVIPASAPQI